MVLSLRENLLKRKMSHNVSTFHIKLSIYGRKKIYCYANWKFHVLFIEKNVQNKVQAKGPSKDKTHNFSLSIQSRMPRMNNILLWASHKLSYATDETS